MTQLCWGSSLGGDESAYRDEVERLTAWCTDYLILNTTKTNELTVDFRKRKMDIQPLYISGDCVERVPDFHFLGVHVMENLVWDVNMAELAKKTQQRLFPECHQEK